MRGPCPSRGMTTRSRSSTAYVVPCTSTGTGSSPASTSKASAVGVRVTRTRRAAPGDPEGQALPAVGQARVEGQPPVVVAHAAEAVDSATTPRRGGDVQPVDGVVVLVGEVDVEGVRK